MSFNSAPSTQTNQLPISVTFPEDNKEFLETLTNLMKRHATTINTKESALYNTIEQVNGQQYFDPNNTQNFRNDFRMVVNFGALPNAGVKSVAHNISFTSSYSVTRIYGAASNTTGLTYIPLPFASPTLNKNIQLDVNLTSPGNVSVTTAIDYSAFNLCYIVIEYLKN